MYQLSFKVLGRKLPRSRLYVPPALVQVIAHHRDHDEIRCLDRGEKDANRFLYHPR